MQEEKALADETAQWRQMKNDTIFAEERKIRVLELVEHDKKVVVGELCELFGVSSATIRNDLRDLQQSDLLIRTHGGAIAKTKTGFELESKQREIQNLAEKQKIAEAALKLIEDGDTIILDTGTTTLELAKCLGQKKDVTIVTNDIQIAAALERIDSGQIIFMGGILRRRFHCTIEIQGRGTFSGLIADKAFMGANSFSLERGAMTPDINQAETKKLMISIANRVVLMCDSTKIGRASFARFATSEQIHTLVTDSLDNEQRRDFEADGLHVVIA